MLPASRALLTGLFFRHPLPAPLLGDYDHCKDIGKRCKSSVVEEGILYAGRQEINP